MADYDHDDIDKETSAQANAMKDLDKFDSKMKGGRFFGAGDDSSEEEENNYKRPVTESDILKEKNNILMDKLYKS